MQNHGIHICQQGSKVDFICRKLLILCLSVDLKKTMTIHYVHDTHGNDNTVILE